MMNFLGIVWECKRKKKKEKKGERGGIFICFDVCPVSKNITLLRN
jgi:hypothetical protein